ncbi:CHASE domain-containing protein [Actimicrobium sp. CCI2.3]|uniref:sensor histidine kinase n=1 Tax=Actimicrobium sp. CCI2.3 TaxID=3048616 RepID=UPI002AB460C3|nr:CHASE domain-containing protein [Actimicrobium sp. CCI2.3]MDY7573941.1 CHASE domain-containing protein [Actimicrobium sp. CCI2.3]MEB0023073.1 CHASE domain-containing protein [Actimicrobium sp. CCI2.3]
MPSAATDLPFSSRRLRTRLKTLLDDVLVQGTWLLPMLALAATMLLVVVVRNEELRIATLDTEQQTQRMMAQLQRHLDNHIQLLRSAAAMLMLDRIVQHRHWTSYLEHLQRLGLPAGLRQLGYAQHLPATDKLALINAMQADGQSDYRIYPLHSGQSLTPVLYAAPENGNPITRAGYDLMSDDLLVPALQHATESASPTLAKLPGRPGTTPRFLLVLPVFPGNIVPEAVPQRREMLIGFVFTVVQIDAELMGLEPARTVPVSLRLFDQQASGPGALLYQSPGELFGARRTLRPVSLHGQTWTLETGSASAPATASIGVAITGLLLAGWLCWLTWEALQRREAIRQRARADAQEAWQSKLQIATLTALNRQAIISIDRQQRIIVFNGAASQLFGTGEDNLLGTPLRELLPHRLKGARPIASLTHHPDDVAVFRLSDQEGQQARRRNGSLFGFEATIFMTGRGRRRCTTILLNELPSNRTSDDMLTDWHKHLKQEVHDDFGQLLTSMKMDLDLLRAQLADAPGASQPATLEHLDRIDELVDAMVGSVRRILADPASEQADEHGLFKALALLVDGHAKRYRIACHLDLPACPPLVGTTLTNQVYRIVQEALNNIAKHAKASAITIHIDAPSDQLLVAISDNGCGFVPQQQAGSKTFGLTGMRERVEALGGTLTIETEIDCGTTIRIRLPLNASTTV